MAGWFAVILLEEQARACARVRRDAAGCGPQLNGRLMASLSDLHDQYAILCLWHTLYIYCVSHMMLLLSSTLRLQAAGWQ